MSTTSQRGSALTVTLATTAALMPLTAFAVMLTQGGFFIQNNTRAQAEAFGIAEAGLVHAVADITPGTTFAALLDGPDKQHGTSDDGRFPFREGAPGFFPAAPLRYDVNVESVNASLLRLTATSYGRRNARAVIETLAARSPGPDVPAALYAPDGVGLAVGHDFLVSGFDHVAGDPPDHPTGTAGALPALGVGNAATANSLQGGLMPAELTRLTGKAGSGSVAEVLGADIVALIGTLSTTPGAVALAVSALQAGAQLGSSAAPQITVLNNDAVLTMAASGTGILIAPTGLHIASSFAFSGLVLARGPVSFDAGSSVRIDGSLWIGGTNVMPILNGSGAITYNHTTLAAADTQFPGCLPHGVVIKGWREVF